MHIFQGKHSLMETMQNLLFLFTEICIIPIVVVFFFYLNANVSYVSVNLPFAINWQVWVSLLQMVPHELEWLGMLIIAIFGANLHNLPFKSLGFCKCAHLQPAEKRAAELPLGSALRRHPRGKTWPWTWSTKGCPASHLEQSPDLFVFFLQAEGWISS